MYLASGKCKYTGASSKGYNRKVIMLLIIFLCCSGCSNINKKGSQPTSDITPGYVIDKAEVLNDTQEESLTKLISDFDKKSTVQIAAMLVDTTNGQEIADFSMEKFNKLGIGQKETNNGAFIVIAVKDRAARITLGYGLEWCISDEDANLIFNKMVPSLKQDKFYDALLVGFNEIVKSTGNVTWDITYTSISGANSEKEKALDKIISFKIKSIKEDEKELTAISVDGSSVLINTTKYMNDLVNNIRTGNVTVTGRIKSFEPFTIDLLSVKEAN